MEIGQPCEIHRFTFKSHAVGDLLGNRLPAQPATRRVRQRPPAINGFEVTHGVKLTGFGGMAKNVGHLQNPIARVLELRRIIPTPPGPGTPAIR